MVVGLLSVKERIYQEITFEQTPGCYLREECSRPVVSRQWPSGQNRPSLACVNFIRTPVTPIHLCIVYGFFLTTAEL